MSGKIRVLCVDDNEVNREVVRELLADEFDLQEAGTGEEALQLLPQVRPDVVLLDIMMPGIDGYETCKRLRADAMSRNCKVILVSAKAMASERMRGYESGADDYVTKPFHAEELLAKVRVFGRLHTVESLDRMKGDLLSILAHELRTPLTGILPAGEVLATEDQLTDEHRRMWGEIVLQNGRRLLHLAERGLLLCSLRAGQRQARVRAVELAALVRDAVDEAVDSARARGCNVQLASAQPLVGETDAELAGQAFRGLLDAAVMSCGDGTDIAVELVAVEELARFAVSMPAMVGGAELHRDLGGVRVREADGQMVGADIGLVLAEAVARVFRGRVQLEHLGDRSVFSLELPMKAKAAVAG